MAYDKKELFERAKAIIKEDDSIVFAEDIICELGISNATFYVHFEKDSEEINTIKELLQENKTKTKRQLRKNWKDKESSAGLQIALYKLIATAEELERLNPPKQKEEERENQETHIENFKPLKKDNE